MVSTDEDGEKWRFLLSIIVLVEGLHEPILGGSCHAIQVFTVTHSLGGGEGGGRRRGIMKEVRRI